MPVDNYVSVKIQNINAVNVDVNVFEGEDQMLALIGANLLFQMLRVYEHIGFTNV